MKLTLAMLALAAAFAGSATAASPVTGALDEARRIARAAQNEHGPAISAVTTTSGVAALELFNPATGWSHSVPAGNGIHFTLCGRVLRRCALPALAARRQALALARRTLRETSVTLVVVALPQTATRHLQLVFERDLLDTTETSAERLTRARLYAMAGLVNGLLITRADLLPKRRQKRSGASRRSSPKWRQVKPRSVTSAAFVVRHRLRSNADSRAVSHRRVGCAYLGSTQRL